MSSKTRMLGAGRAGSTAYGSNVNLVQFGNRLQGLAPQATHFFISGNGRAGWNQYQTRTYAPKRNYIFCMNQLGGVGRGKSQFKVGGLNKPDGAKICKPHEYQLPKKINNNKTDTTNSVEKSIKGVVTDNRTKSDIQRENLVENNNGVEESVSKEEIKEFIEDILVGKFSFNTNLRSHNSNDYQQFLKYFLNLQIVEIPNKIISSLDLCFFEKSIQKYKTIITLFNTTYNKYTKKYVHFKLAPDKSDYEFMNDDGFIVNYYPPDLFIDGYSNYDTCKSYANWTYPNAPAIPGNYLESKLYLRVNFLYGQAEEVFEINTFSSDSTLCDPWEKPDPTSCNGDAISSGDMGYIPKYITICPFTNDNRNIYFFLFTGLLKQVQWYKHYTQIESPGRGLVEWVSPKFYDGIEIIPYTQRYLITTTSLPLLNVDPDYGINYTWRMAILDSQFIEPIKLPAQGGWPPQVFNKCNTCNNNGDMNIYNKIKDYMIGKFPFNIQLRKGMDNSPFQFYLDNFLNYSLTLSSDTYVESIELSYKHENNQYIRVAKILETSFDFDNKQYTDFTFGYKNLNSSFSVNYYPPDLFTDNYPNYPTCTNPPNKGNPDIPGDYLNSKLYLIIKLKPTDPDSGAPKQEEIYTIYTYGSSLSSCNPDAAAPTSGCNNDSLKDKKYLTICPIKRSSENIYYFLFTGLLGNVIQPLEEYTDEDGTKKQDLASTTYYGIDVIPYKDSIPDPYSDTYPLPLLDYKDGDISYGWKLAILDSQFSDPLTNTPDVETSKQTNTIFNKCRECANPN